MAIDATTRPLTERNGPTTGMLRRGARDGRGDSARHAVATGASICASGRTRTNAASAPTRSSTKSRLLNPPLATFSPVVPGADDPPGPRTSNSPLWHQQLSL